VITLCIAQALGVYGHDFKKEFSPILKAIDEKKFETLFTNFKNKYLAKFKANSPGQKRIDELYEIKHKWTFCYIGKTFSAGINLASINPIF